MRIQHGAVTFIWSYPCSAGSPSLSDSEGIVSPGYQHVVSYKSLQEKAFSAWVALNVQPRNQEQLNFVCMVPRYPLNLGPSKVLHVQHQDLTEKTAFRGLVA